MQRFQAVSWLVLFVLSAHIGRGQGAGSTGATVTITGSLPVSLPLAALLNTLPQRLSLDDSLDRQTYARHKVKTITVLRQRQAPPDTAEYYELDRRGNRILIAKPYGGQHRQQRFDKRNRLVELVLLPTPGYPLRSSIVYDPKLRLYTSYFGETGAAALLWQQSQTVQRGDTLTTDAVFQAVPELPIGAIQRIMAWQYRIGGDTSYFELIGYGADKQPIEFTAYYSIGKRGQLLENGEIDFRPRPLTSSAAVPGARTSAAELLRLKKIRRGRFIPNTRNVYNAQGRLIQSTYLANPDEIPERPVTTKSASADGSYKMTLTDTGTSPVLSYSTRYVRAADGRLQREERTYVLKPGTTDPDVLRQFKPSAIEYEYTKQGLLLRRSEGLSSLTGKPVVYEVRYTYY